MSGKMVKIPVKISHYGDESCSNVMSFSMKGISHFNNNIKDILDSLSTLEVLNLETTIMMLKVAR